MHSACQQSLGDCKKKRGIIATLVWGTIDRAVWRGNVGHAAGWGAALRVSTGRWRAGSPWFLATAPRFPHNYFFSVGGWVMRTRLDKLTTFARGDRTLDCGRDVCFTGMK